MKEHRGWSSICPFHRSIRINSRMETVQTASVHAHKGKAIANFNPSVRYTPTEGKTPPSNANKPMWTNVMPRCDTRGGSSRYQPPCIKRVEKTVYLPFPLKPILNFPSAQLLFSSRERERESKLYTRIFVFILLSPCIPSPLLYDAILFTPPPWILFTSPFRSLRVLSSLVSRGIGVNYRHGINPYYYYYYYKLSRFSSKGKLEIRINCLNNAIYV